MQYSSRMSKKDVLNSGLAVLATCVAAVVLFTMAMYAVYAVPRHAIEDNAVRSIDVLHAEGQERTVAANNLLFRLDNFTDCLMVNIALSAPDDDRTTAAMLNPMHLGDIKNQVDQTWSWAHRADSVSPPQVNYGRYWHGYQVPLRLLLTVTDYRGIRLANALLLALLTLTLLVLCWRRVAPSVSLALLLSLLLVMMPVVVPWSMQYSTCFIVMLLASIAVLAMKRVGRSLPLAAALMAATGALTAFLDLLTTPVLTLGFPLAFYLLASKPANKWRVAMLLVAAWAVGYAGTWAAKWVVAGVITGEDVLSDAMRTARYRTVGRDVDSSSIVLVDLLKHYWAMVTPLQGVVLVAVAAAALALLRLLARGWRVMTRHLLLLAVAALPLLWYALLAQHSFQHRWFTWRSLAVTFFALFCYLIYTVKDGRQQSKQQTDSGAHSVL